MTEDKIKWSRFLAKVKHSNQVGEVHVYHVLIFRSRR